MGTEKKKSVGMKFQYNLNYLFKGVKRTLFFIKLKEKRAVFLQSVAFKVTCLKKEKLQTILQDARENGSYQS